MATKEKEIGKVIHWYGKINVAVVKLASGLKVGDTIKVRHGDGEFEETVNSMQLDHKPIDTGKKGQEIAIQLSQEAKDGSVIYSA
jgi:putative protease